MSGLGFALPALLAAIPAALMLLVYVYRNKGQSQAVIVSSILLLKSLKRSRPARKTFLPPIRFFLELALFILLALSAAGLFKEGGKKKIALLLDNSPSMGAIDLSHHAAQSLFIQAKEQAESYLDSLEMGSEVKLYVTSPLLTPIDKSALSPSSAARALRNVELAYGPDRLDAALSTLALDATFDQITVVSHRKAAAPAEIQSGKLLEAPTDKRVSFISVGNLANFSNVAIVDLGRSQGEKSVRLAVSVAAKSSERTASTVVVKSVNSDLSEREVKRERIELQPGETKVLSFDGLSKDLAYKVELTDLSPSSDTIKQDNLAWVSASEDHSKIIVVSALSIKELGLERIGTFSFEQLQPGEYSPERLSNVSATLLFHDYVPAELPSLSSLFVAPPPGDPIFNAGNLVDGADLGVTSWSESHPVASYINFAALRLRALTPLPLPDWATSIVSTTSGAAIIAGENGERRFAAVGFEILPFDGARSPLLSILTLNILRWLSDSKLSSGFEMLPTSIKLESEVLKVGSPSGKLFKSKDDGDWEAALSEPGLYQVERRSGVSLLAVNFINESESDLIGNPSVPLPVGSTSPQQGDDNYYLREVLLPPILMLLLIELLFWSWKLFRWHTANRERLGTSAVR